MKEVILIGIAGASGSGKTLVSENICKKIGSEYVIIIEEDSYYRDLSDIPFDERNTRNFDHPEAFDNDLLNSHIRKLLNGQSINQPVYDYTTHRRKDETKLVAPHSIVVLEGILILNDPTLRDQFDIKVFIDTAPDICFIRRLRRDIEQRGRDVNSVINQYMDTVRPMYFQFVEPSKRYADIIIPEGGKNVIAIDILTTKIKSLLQEMGVD